MPRTRALFCQREPGVRARCYCEGTGDLTWAAQLFEQVWNEILPTLFASTPTDYCYGHRPDPPISQCFEQALKHDPGRAAMNNLGSVLKDVARYDEALVWLRRGRSITTTSSPFQCVVPPWAMSWNPQVHGYSAAFAERFGQHPFERWRDEFLILIHNGS